MGPARRAALALLILAGACGGPGAAVEDPFDATAPRSVDVVVRNLYELEATVIALGPGVRQRLGTVGPGRRARFQVPWGEVGELSLRVEPLTGTTFTSNALPVRPGDAVLMTIASRLDRSVLIRR